MTATFLVGYDVEHGDPELTAAFLTRADEVHSALGAPATMFVVGRTLEKNVDRFRQIAANPLFDLQQHTYSHLLLKTVCAERPDGIQVQRGGTLEQIRDDVSKASDALRDLVGVDCIGITGPWNYYRGLRDRPDILDILWELGIRFARTDGRNERDWQPVPFELQPYWYKPQGYPTMMEFGIQGWQDCLLRDKVGWADLDAYAAEIRAGLDLIAERDLVWSYCQHDWSSTLGDPQMRMTEGILKYALKKNIRLMTYRQFYEEALKVRPASS